LGIRSRRWKGGHDEEIKAHRWQLWTYGQVSQEVNGIRPLLASWEKRTHPEQVRLRSYLEDLTSRLGPLPPAPTGLFLHMGYDLLSPQRRHSSPAFGVLRKVRKGSQRFLKPWRRLRKAP
jgi:hypothetical protein